MKLRKLQILMWRHLIVRKRHFIQTPIEIISPIVFFVIMFCFKNKINPPSSTTTRLNALEIKNTDVLNVSQLARPWRVLYTPNTKHANDLMDAVGSRLHLERLTPTTLLSATKGYCGFSNVSDIDGWIKKLNTNDAIIMFDDLEEDVWPVHLSYTIRLKGAFLTNEISAQHHNKGSTESHKEFGDNYHRFMSLQWAIDTSFIEILSGYNITQGLSVQEFPAIARANAAAVVAVSFILQITSWLSLLLVFQFLTKRLLIERCSGIKELVKVMGISSNLFGISHFLNVVPAGLVYSVVGTVLLKVTSSPLIANSNGFIICINLALHYVSIVSMAFPCSYIIQDVQYSETFSMLMYILLWIPDKYINGHNVDGVTLASGLLPHVALRWLWVEVEAHELEGKGLTFSDVYSSHSGPSGPVALGALCMVVQALMMFALTWYLAQVRPGQYGRALPWNFCIQKQYWSKKEVMPEVDADEEVPVAREAKYFEEPPKSMEAGIKVENVSKVYPKHTALNNVSLDVYKGEITVLLGHNGAGKTTLMSIITGMISATEGRVLVNGIDLTKASDEVRMQLGLCPQHNMFFPDLTVIEHVKFFTLIKGGSFKDAHQASYELLEKLGIRDKAEVPVSALSGGMKRRLQLACALAGGASVLVLDEPTSGLDVEKRREMWDLLLSLRGERTVLLTTHFMEEADALGDRVAALHAGRLRCFATTMYLKKAIGTGYRMTFTTKGPPREEAITAVITSLSHDATLKEKTINSLSYNLPASHSKNFPALFTALEQKKSELGIETIGVGVSTLEEVFLKLCSDTDTGFAGNEVVEHRTSEPTYNKVTGPVLKCRQLKVLLKRQYRYAMHKKISYLILKLILPIALIFAITAMFKEQPTDQNKNEDILLDMNLYSGFPERRVMYDVTPNVRLRTLNDAWSKVHFKEAHNVTGAVLRASEENVTDYQKYIAGIEINDTHAKALYTTTIRHAAPIAVNLLTNALATRYMEHADGRTFLTRINPISPLAAFRSDGKLAEPKSEVTTLAYCLMISCYIFITLSGVIALSCKEMTTSTRHIHMMSGCSSVVHWAATLVFHACYAVILLAAVAVAIVVFDANDTLKVPSALLSIVLVLMVGSLTFLALAYLVSFFLSENFASLFLVVLVIAFGLITPSLKMDLKMVKEILLLDVFLSVVKYTMPPHTATSALVSAGNTARLNAICKNLKSQCPNLITKESMLNVKKCCAGERPHCYLCMEEAAPGQELVILTVQFIILMTLVIIIQMGMIDCIYDTMCNGHYRNSVLKTQTASDDEIVRNETMFVDKQIALPKDKIEESGQAMLVSNLHKNFHSVCSGRSCNAVKGISFSVKKGECFGLLGVNGAGKSTTFKMLTAEECPTMGKIYGNGFFRNERQPYLHSLGYCPQFFGLDDFLTGRENLELLLTLRGLDAKDVSEEAKSWIDVVGLEKYSDRKVVGYSGGCARRLAAAAALSSGAPLTLLDEPTAGVDVSARRRVWSALQRGLAQGRAVIITSHSMDEMEALCARIAIMSAGLIRALGTPSELRARHAVGHAVLIKMLHVTHTDDVVVGTKSEVEKLKDAIQSKFNCTLRDEHMTMLHYHINETMRYSYIFTALEELQAKFPSLVEDYSVTETTLEEVFLSYAKEQHQNHASGSRNYAV